ncbi:MAG: hypothetical protein GC168_00890 [Candidatus Hydrogenedens sp.]|nr:hypothetical protein [Candidatus Hydrogenedens sp.]
MPLAKCPRTGKLFDNTKGLVHPSAKDQEEADYEKIADYLAQHPNAKPDEVCEAVEVTVDCINRMVKSGRVKEFDEAALKAQAVEQAEREAEIAERNLRMSRDLSSVLQKRPARKEPEIGKASMHNRSVRSDGGKR